MRRGLSRGIAFGVIAAGVAVAAGVAWIMLPPGALGFAGGRAVALADYKAVSPVGAPAALRSADLVKRGEYLAYAADCEICHTAGDGARYAGGRAFKTPFGTLYSPNITPDRESGIGDWSDADFIRALHQGIAPDGVYLYPAFPYDSYTLMTDDDALAIKAYLFSLPAVRAEVRPNDLAFPFNQRWLMRIWAGAYNPDARFRPNEDRSPEWNRGAYLVEALGHCGECHTPRNAAQALDNRQKFAGTVIGGWRAYNITPDKTSGIGAWSDDELAAYLSTGHAVGHGSAGGPMAEVADSLRLMAPDDIRAIVVYLRSIPPIATPGLVALRPTPASDSPREISARVDPRGRQVFAEACASCHGWSGVSLLTGEATLTGDRAVNDRDAVNVAQIIIGGEQRRADGHVAMPAFGQSYSDAEIAAVANYVSARFGAEGSALTAADIARLRLE